MSQEKQQQEQSLSTLRIWFILVNGSDGQPYKGTSADTVSLPSDSLVAHFRKAIKAEYSDKLSSMDTEDLLVYKNKAAFNEENEAPLEEDSLVDGLGTSEDEALVVIVPHRRSDQGDICMSFNFPGLTQPMDVKQFQSQSPQEQVRHSLLQLINSEVGASQNLFRTRDSMESIPSDLLDLDIVQEDGTANFLYSEKIYSSEKEIGITMPVEKLKMKSQNMYVLLGVNGCGKTRTCFDLCRSTWALYFDCARGGGDEDFLFMADCLGTIVPYPKTYDSQEWFETESTHRIMCLLASRWLVLEFLRAQSSGYKPFDWLCTQRNQRTKKLFLKIFKKLVDVPKLIAMEIYQDLHDSFDGVLIFDEAHAMLSMLYTAYRSARPYQRSISREGCFEYPRSLFHFMTLFVRGTQLTSLWCGTRMNISEIERSCTAVGLLSGPKDIILFTDFTYLSPSDILKLLYKWVKIPNKETLAPLFGKIAHHLQGRPRFFTSFLHAYIEKKDLDLAFKTYFQKMTTRGVENMSRLTPYFYWEEKIGFNIEPLRPCPSQDFCRQLKVETLVRLCAAYMFSDGTSVPIFDHDLVAEMDLISSALVMIRPAETEELMGWKLWMAEPLVLIAGINYLSKNVPMLLNVVGKTLFTKTKGPHLTPQERGHVMKLAITLRFIQGWWREPAFTDLLPLWIYPFMIPRPEGLMDCRFDESSPIFLQQLSDPNFPCVLLPPPKAGPDIRYSVFCCYVKTSSEETSVYVEPTEAEKNMFTMNPQNWYHSDEAMHTECQKLLAGQRFIHLRFELPDTVPSMKDRFVSGEAADQKSYVICVNLDSEFAVPFFGEDFMSKYREFVSLIQGRV